MSTLSAVNMLSARPDTYARTTANPPGRIGSAARPRGKLALGSSSGLLPERTRRLATAWVRVGIPYSGCISAAALAPNGYEAAVALISLACTS